MAEIYANAIEAYRVERDKNLKLYPGVKDALQQIRAAGCLIVVYTESMAFYSNSRIRYFGLDGIVDYLYSPPDHDLPLGLTREQVRRYPSTKYELKETRHCYTPQGVLKPSEQVLISIITTVRATVEDTLYVGDSLLKDILMAQRAGVRHAWAKYGEAHQREAYDLLRAVTHWTDEMVQKERELKHEHVQPSITLRKSFSELFEHFKFEGQRKYTLAD
ncbi:MAG: HAD family hydrolase [Acidiferrobacterales bacterium]